MKIVEETVKLLEQKKYHYLTLKNDFIYISSSAVSYDLLDRKIKGFTYLYGEFK